MYFGERKEYRDMEQVARMQPDFESPEEHRKFMRGNSECRCVCNSKFLPRNAILFRPKTPEEGRRKYNLLKSQWRKGTFERMAHGSCQQFINSCDLKRDCREILEGLSVSCIDNMEGLGLMPGDIVITRHGERSVGKPHLIK